MKTKKVKYEIECQRSNVTPKQFYNYCKTQAFKQGLNIEDWAIFEEWTNEKQGIMCNTQTIQQDVKRTEMVKYAPYDWHLYLQGVYNFILEFSFYDDKTGWGYFYAVEFAN